MEIRLADRMQHLKASDIREILKLTARPEVISFAGGLPAMESFPVDDIAAAVHACCAQDGASVLQYSTTEGDPELRAEIAARMNRLRGTAVTPDQILVTSGAQQGLDLSGKLFLDRGSTVLCESPTYLAALNAFKVFEARLVAVATDDQGMRPDALAHALRTEPDVRLIYVIPDSQNPSGRTWSMERRRALVELAADAGVVVIEDSPYGEIRFDGDPLPAVASLADDRTAVVYLGTFSKVFCPGMRLGWVAGPSAIVHKYVLLKQSADLHTSTLSQRVAARYLAANDLDANVARVITMYRERRDAMLAALDEYFPSDASWTRPQGGLFVWVELPRGIDARELLERALAHDVAFVPGAAFFPEPGHDHTMRLNFSAMPPDRIHEGVRRLAAVLDEMLEPAVADSAGA
jgi:2-aminoadipate transaminase